MPKIEIFTGPGCGYCTAAKALLRERKLRFTERDISDEAVRAELLKRLPRARTIPQIFMDGEPIGGYDDLRHRLR
ncbi:glutaredoxin family protein [Oceanibacterium hippocampi]|uniref:Glutaredoxin-3 n=1 Tax=Oceanibacterium hippocampi TaxID=745714 RepID=A0A1Y5T5F2_9PROT|nr:glutaredoxin [Oceanibacterium hippocampi]SLN56356.1 Glutaredoxin-3 [Oceanibacterium hippocampi]